MMAAKILNCPCPIDSGQQAIVTEAHALQSLGRRNVEDIFERGAGAQPVELAKQENGPCHGREQHSAEKKRDPG